MIKMALISVVFYGFGCGWALWFFLTGRTPALNERNWRWPVIFIWPLLILWPFYALAGYFLRYQLRRRK